MCAGCTEQLEPDSSETQTPSTSPEIAGTDDTNLSIGYNGQKYVYTESLECNAETYAILKGESLSGTVDKTTSDGGGQNSYTGFPGSVYKVNGYDDNFRICQATQNDAGGTFAFYENLTNSNLQSGKGLFGDMGLRLLGNYDSVVYQTHEHWNQEMEIFQPLEQQDYDDLASALMEASFELDTPYMGPEHQLKQAHVIYQMKDGTYIRLRLYENGAITYQGLKFQIVDDVFQRIFQIATS